MKPVTKRWRKRAAELDIGSQWENNGVAATYVEDGYKRTVVLAGDGDVLLARLERLGRALQDAYEAGKKMGALAALEKEG